MPSEARHRARNRHRTSIPTPSSRPAPRLRQAIGNTLAPDACDLLRLSPPAAPIRPTPPARAGARCAMPASICGRDAATRPRSRWSCSQYRSADNMTDRLAALAALSLHDVPERQAAFDDFYKRFENDAACHRQVVHDPGHAFPKQATLARVKDLLAHPAFSLGNPESRALARSARSRSQIRPSSTAPMAPATTSLRISCCTLDPKNPQVAARLMTAFRTWRTLEPSRRALAEHALTRVAETPALSRDVADIAERSLAAELRRKTCQ